MRTLNIPNLISAARILLAPVMILLAWRGESKIYLGCLLASFLSDILDGYLARRLNQSSELGAKLDSWADSATFLSIPLCAWWLWPELVRRELVYAAAGLASYIAALCYGFIKFGQLTSYHTWGAKLAAAITGMSLLIMFATETGWPFRFAVLIVILSQVEEIAITAMLPKWQANLPSFWHARQFARRPSQPGPNV